MKTDVLVSILRMLPEDKMKEFIKSASEEVVKEIDAFLEEQRPLTEEEEKLASSYVMGQAMAQGFLDVMTAKEEQKEKT